MHLKDLQEPIITLSAAHRHQLFLKFKTMTKRFRSHFLICRLPPAALSWSTPDDSLRAAPSSKAGGALGTAAVAARMRGGTATPDTEPAGLRKVTATRPELAVLLISSPAPPPLSAALLRYPILAGVQ